MGRGWELCKLTPFQVSLSLHGSSETAQNNVRLQRGGLVDSDDLDGKRSIDAGQPTGSRLPFSRIEGKCDALQVVDALLLAALGRAWERMCDLLPANRTDVHTNSLSMW